MSSIWCRRKDQRPCGSHMTGEQRAQKPALLPAMISPKMRGTKLVLAASSFVDLHKWYHSSQADPRPGELLQRLHYPIGRVASSQEGEYRVECKDCEQYSI